MHFLLIAVNLEVLLWPQRAPCLSQKNNFPHLHTLFHTPPLLPKQDTKVSNPKKWCSPQFCVHNVIIGMFSFPLDFALACIIMCSGYCPWRCSCFFYSSLSHARHSGSHRRPPSGPVHHQGEWHQREQREPCQCHRSCHCMQEVQTSHTGEPEEKGRGMGG